MNTKKEKRTFWFKVGLVAFCVALLWAIHLVNVVFGLNLTQYSVWPKMAKGLLGIPVMPLLHGSWNHLVSNSLPLFVLCTLLLVIYQRIAFVVIGLIWIISGLITWLIGVKGSVHVGASGVVYGLGFFLFWAGMFTKNRNAWALALFVVLWYGSMIWGIFPFGVEEKTSWEGHLGGAIAGFLLAVIYFGNQISFTMQGNEVENVHFFEKHPLPNFTKDNY